MTQAAEISIVIPLFKCEQYLAELDNSLHVMLNKITTNYEVIYINDASPENDWSVVQGLAANNPKIIGINLSRNFGQHYAITAGLEKSSGEWVVVMDGDLQDRPLEVINLYNKAKEGFDVVLGRRLNRQHSFYKKLFSYLFYKVLGFLTDTKQDSTVANFGIYHRKVINAICSMSDYSRYFPTMVSWVGFKCTSIEVQHTARVYGKSAYTFKKLLSLALDVIVVFSDKPLKITVKLGILMSAGSLSLALYYIFSYLHGDIEVMGWTTLIVSIWFLFGLLIFILGIIGLYISKIFEQVKGRPTFIVKDTINSNS